MPISEELNTFLQETGTLLAKETAEVISTVISKDITLALGDIEESSAEALAEKFPEPVLSVRFNLTPREDDVVFVFLNQALGAQVASQMMMEEEATDFTDAHKDTVKEMGEQVLGSLATVLSEHIGREVRFGSVRVEIMNIDTDFPELENPLSLNYSLNMGDDNEQPIIQLASMDALSRFQTGEEGGAAEGESMEDTAEGDGAGVESMEETAEEGGAEGESMGDIAEEGGAEGESMEETAEDGGAEGESADGEIEDMLLSTDMEGDEESPEEEEAGSEDEESAAPGGMDDFFGEEGSDEDSMSMGEDEEPEAASQEQAAPEHDEEEAPPEKIEVLLDLSLPVSIELGRTKMLIKDILELGHGSVIEFDKLAGEPVDLLIHDKKIAEGEVVVIDEHFGIRLTNLIKTKERLKQLGG